MREQRKSISQRQRRALKDGFLVYKAGSSYAVLRESDHRFDRLSFVEGLGFRLGLGLPKRILTWAAPDGSVQVSPTQSSEVQS